MSSSLKSRIVKLEAAGTEATYPGIVIYFENRVTEQDEDERDVVVSAEYYLNKDGSGAPLTIEELQKALEGKIYITYIPTRR